MSPSSALAGKVFCITGKLSMVRKDLQALLCEHGGATEATVNSSVTHLISSDSTTKKAIDAANKGLAIVTETQVMAMIHGSNDVVDLVDSDDDDADLKPPPSKKPKKVEVATLATVGKPLEGFNFCITGTLSQLRKDIETILIANGAQVQSTVTKKVTHLLCNDNTTSKANKARALGIEIVTEQWVTALVVASKSGGSGSMQVSSTLVASAHDGSPRKIADGECVTVAGKKYVMKNIGGVYSCSCPGWKFQSKQIDIRTCKHLKEYLGVASEKERLGEDFASTGRATLTGGGTSTGGANKKGKNTKTANKTTASNDNDDGLFRAKDCMLAHKYNVDKHDEPQNFLLSEKLDGMRAIWNGTQLMSRAGNPIDAPDFFLDGFPTDMALDGELFAGRGQFQHTVSIARRKNGGDLWRELKFVVFDAPSLVGFGFEDRLAKATVAVVACEFIQIHPHEPCRDVEHLNEELERVQALGGEGLMMRKAKSAYQSGRSHELLKVKTFQDDDAIVMDHQAGKGRHKGRMGALVCKLRNGTEFKVGSGFSDKEREDPPCVDSIITFRFFELTMAGVPRFPVFVRLRRDLETSEFGGA